jgi:hypothetical protein
MNNDNSHASTPECLMPVVFLDSPPAKVARRPLTEADAIDIWVARWLRVPRKELLRRYACDPRRLYEIWEGTHFPGSRAKALERLAQKHPWLLERIDPGAHRRIAKTPHPDQMRLFD